MRTMKTSRALFRIRECNEKVKDIANTNSKVAITHRKKRKYEKRVSIFIIMSFTGSLYSVLSKEKSKKD